MVTFKKLALARRKFTSVTALSTTLSASISVMEVSGKQAVMSKWMRRNL